MEASHPLLSPLSRAGTTATKKRKKMKMKNGSNKGGLVLVLHLSRGLKRVLLMKKCMATGFVPLIRSRRLLGSLLEVMRSLVSSL